MAKCNPYLTFNGNCRDAMNFYKECIGGELSVIVAGESPAGDQMPPHLKDKLLHSELRAGELVLMATDMQPETLSPGNDVHICLICNSEEEMKSLWEKLSAGGTIKQPISPMFFGLIGTFADKFGKSWILECDKK